jgi:hypothetical protein
LSEEEKRVVVVRVGFWSLLEVAWAKRYEDVKRIVE